MSLDAANLKKDTLPEKRYTLIVSLAQPDAGACDLLRLHRIAHTLGNGAALTISAQDEPFVDQVSGVIDQLDQYVAELLAICDVLQPLETLRLYDTDSLGGL